MKRVAISSSPVKKGNNAYLTSHMVETVLNLPGKKLDKKH